jgi:hypothetical protein
MSTIRYGALPRAPAHERDRIPLERVAFFVSSFYWSDAQPRRLRTGAGYPLCLCREFEGLQRARGSRVPGGIRSPVCPRHQRIVWGLKSRDTRGSRGTDPGTQRLRGDREHEFEARERPLPNSETTFPTRLDSSRCRSRRDGSLSPVDLPRVELSIRKCTAPCRLPKPRSSRASGRRGVLTPTTPQP